MTWQKKEHCVNQTDRQTYPGAAHQRSPATHTQDEPPSALPTHSWSSLPPHTDTGATLTQPAERRRDEDTVIAGLRQSKSPPWIFRADLSKPLRPPPCQEQRWAAGRGANGRSSSSRSTCSDSSQGRSTPVRRLADFEWRVSPHLWRYS